MDSWEIGVISSALGTNQPFQALGRAKEIGFDVLHLSWLDSYVGGLWERIYPGNVLLGLRVHRPRLHALCISHNRNIGIDEWKEHSKKYIDLAGYLELQLATEHVRAIDGDNLGQMMDVIGYLVEYGSKVGVRYALETGNETLDIMVRIAEKLPDVGFCFDPGNFLQRGLSNTEVFGFLAALNKKVCLAHVKDAIEGSFTRLGSGSLDILGYVRALRDNGYGGPLIIEDSRQPVEIRYKEIRKSRDALIQLLNE